jgi:hypothetical protein
LRCATAKTVERVYHEYDKPGEKDFSQHL